MQCRLPRDRGLARYQCRRGYHGTERTIARAFIAKPTVLILDEATSSVDTRTELLVQRAMARLRTGRTCFVSAHRLSTIRDADMIVYMDAGNVLERGSHDALMAERGAYWRLYQSQFKTGQPSTPKTAAEMRNTPDNAVPMKSSPDATIRSSSSS